MEKTEEDEEFGARAGEGPGNLALKPAFKQPENPQTSPCRVHLSPGSIDNSKADMITICAINRCQCLNIQVN